MFGIDKREHPERMNHYDKLKDDIVDWQHMEYAGSNREIDILGKITKAFYQLMYSNKLNLTV